MTMLGRNDTEEASYLELAEFIATFGEPDHIADDLAQLFRRVLFNVATANRDDHLRNHGFIRTPAGWRLAPAFDMNPSFKKNEHTLALDLYSREPSLALVLETAGYYRLSATQAKAMCDHVLSIVVTWPVRAKRLGIPSAECEEAEHLFVH